MNIFVVKTDFIKWRFGCTRNHYQVKIINLKLKEFSISEYQKTGKYISAVYEDYDGIKILDRADSELKLKVEVILQIDKIKPTLNTQINSQTEFRYNVNE